jgi:hypothetical protein
MVDDELVTIASVTCRGIESSNIEPSQIPILVLVINQEHRHCNEVA